MVIMRLYLETWLGVKEKSALVPWPVPLLLPLELPFEFELQFVLPVNHAHPDHPPSLLKLPGGPPFPPNPCADTGEAKAR